MNRVLAVAVAAAGSLLLLGCSSDEGGETVAITASDTACDVAVTSLAKGSHTFEVENAGDVVTEVYVYAPGDKVVTEKENIGPGTRARFTAKLDPGTYEIACKPGQKGSGIRQPLTVT